MRWPCIWADLLKHDKVLSKKPSAPHLRDVLDYLLDPTTQEARKMVKLARAAMGNTNPSRRQGSKRKSRKNRNHLKTFSAEVYASIPTHTRTILSVDLKLHYKDFLTLYFANLISGIKESSQRWDEERRKRWSIYS